MKVSWLLPPGMFVSGVQVARGGAAAVALLLYCYFENVKEENDCSEHKEAA